MAFRALLFSNDPETNTALTKVCASADIRLEVCPDIFSAIEKGTKQPFSAVLADWSNQPEAGFLLRRARESSPNKNLVAIAIVDHDPTAAEIRDHRLEFLIYRPVVATEAEEVLAKAAEKMQAIDTGKAPEPPPATEPANDESFSAPTEAPEPSQDSYDPNEAPVTESSAAETAGDAESTTGATEEEPVAPRHAFPFRQACAAVLLLATAFCLWNARDTIIYLARTREGRINVLKDAVATLFYLNSSGAGPVLSVASDAQQDTYFSRNASASDTQQIRVVATEAELGALPIRLPKPPDFPLPTPVYEPPPPVPVHVQRGAVPDSLRGSAPITRPVVVTPAQMMPVSMPVVPPLPQQFSEPVALSEDAARALLVHSVNPTYPPEAMSQKLRGPVVLQATIGRDGSVEDLKIVRGSFLLCKVAIAAVKQWRFQPYIQNGRAAQTQTVLTINF